jgi:nucleotide-binding universal stress UspA family protein
MTYRSILTLLDDTPACATRIRAAIAIGLAARCQLVGVAPTRADAAAASDGPAQLARAASAIRQFDRACTDAGIGSLATMVEDADCREAFAAHVNESDLAILTQSPATDNGESDKSFIEEAVLASARPILVLPQDGVDAHTGLGKRILVAWDGSREATRAIVDALPLLRGAAQVQLVGWHRHAGDERDRLSERLARARSWLKRHDVSAVARLEPCDGDIASSMLARAADLDCDLIVMGAYGPSRFGDRGQVSVSRRVLAVTTLPVMMSH